MTDLIADLNRIRERACSDVLHRDTPLDPAEVATVCRRAVEALTPPGDVGDLVARLPGLWFGFNPGTGEPDGTSCTVKPHDEHYARRFIPAEVVADALSTQSAALALVTRERDEARAQVDACAEYLKPGETPAERIKREHDDCCALMAMLAKDRGCRDAAEAERDALKAENERLREFYAAQERVRQSGLLYASGEQHRRLDAARAALTPGRAAAESGKAGDDEG